jgi:hypothetical protein
VVSKLGASGVSQGCREFLETGLLLTSILQKPTISGFLLILIQTDCTVVSALTTMV